MEDYAGIYGSPVPFFDDNWTIVFPVSIRCAISDSKECKYADRLMYIASSKEAAIEWCKKNTDLEVHDDNKHWWFVITQEAIDGEYSGIGGIEAILDWNAHHLNQQPLAGYKDTTKKTEAEKEPNE